MATLEEVTRLAFELPDRERAILAEELFESVEEFEMSPELQAEIERRVAEVRAGTAELVSAEDAIASARAAIANVRTTSSRR